MKKSSAKKITQLNLKNPEFKKLVTSLNEEQSLMEILKSKIKIASQMSPDNPYSSSMSDSLKKIIEIQRKRKEQRESTIEKFEHRISAFERKVQLEKERRLDNFSKYQDLLDKYTFAKNTVKLTQGLHNEIRLLQSQQDSFLNRIEILKHKLIQASEKMLRDQCELQIMEQAFIQGGKWQDDMQMQALRL